MTILSFDLQVWPWPSTLLNNCFTGTLTCQGELCQIILKSIHKCTNYGPDKLSLWRFYCLIFKCDLDLQSTSTNVSNGTSSHQGEQPCKIIFKSMHKCRSYGLDKLNLWPFYNLTFKCDLDLQPTEHVFQTALLLLEENNYAKCFWNPCTDVQIMTWTNPGACIHTRTYTELKLYQLCLAHQKGAWQKS